MTIVFEIRKNVFKNKLYKIYRTQYYGKLIEFKQKLM